MIKLIITYNDGKILEVNDLKDKDAKHFFECLSKHEFYWDNAKNRGFWTDIDQIRHVVAEKHSPQGENNVSKDQASNPMHQRVEDDRNEADAIPDRTPQTPKTEKEDSLSNKVYDPLEKVS